VLGRRAGQEPVEPAAQPLKAGCAPGQDFGGDQQLPEEVQGRGLGESIQRLVAERKLAGHDRRQQPGAVAALQPDEGRPGLVDLQEHAAQRAQRRADGAVGAGQ
jgi:hypothetical protein